jgi:small subunit ribosomal protein S16
MALKIRLRQQGRNNRPFYRVVVADVRSPRDGKYVEALGWYNPFEAELDKNFYIKPDRVQHWLDLGAQLTESVESLVLKVAPQIVQRETEKEVARRSKATAKRKARKKAAA